MSGHLHTDAEESQLYNDNRCAWCEAQLPEEAAVTRLTCSERCRRARSRARQRAS